MFIKQLPLSLILVFTVIGSGFFYAQEIPSQYICPRGDSLHRGFICECSVHKIQADSAILKQLYLQINYCPRGIHNFICQCSVARNKQDQKILEIKKQKKFKRNRKSPRLEQ